MNNPALGKGLSRGQNLKNDLKTQTQARGNVSSKSKEELMAKKAKKTVKAKKAGTKRKKTAPKSAVKKKIAKKPAKKPAKAKKSLAAKTKRASCQGFQTEAEICCATESARCFSRRSQPRVR